MAPALPAVGQGQALLYSSLTERVFAQVRRAAHDQQSAAFAMLSEQERRVLALVAEGRSTARSRWGSMPTQSYGYANQLAS